MRIALVTGAAMLTAVAIGASDAHAGLFGNGSCGSWGGWRARHHQSHGSSCYQQVSCGSHAARSAHHGHVNRGHGSYAGSAVETYSHGSHGQAHGGYDSQGHVDSRYQTTPPPPPQSGDQSGMSGAQSGMSGGQNGTPGGRSGSSGGGSAESQSGQSGSSSGGQQQGGSEEAL